MSDSEEPTDSAATPIRGKGCLIAVVTLTVLGLIVAVVIAFAIPWATGKGLVAAKKTIVDAFSPETITETFITWNELETQATDGNILEVSTATATEVFERKSDLKLWDRKMPLGTTVSEISVPATYRYHIDLNGDWQLTTIPENGRVLAIVPRLQPSLPVAFDTGEMKKKSKSGWGRWDADENMAALEKTLTTELNLRAAEDKTIKSVRDESRKAVAKFIQRWLMTADRWGTDQGFSEITVVFEDEIEQEDGTILDITKEQPVIRDATAPVE